MSSDASSIAGPTDSESASSNTPSSNTLPSNFYSVMRREYPDTRGPLPLGRKRRSKGSVSYICNICDDWSHSHRHQARIHVQNRHSLADPASRPMTQSRISNIFSPVTSAVALRDAFNVQAYREALIGLFTRRRLPLSAIEWKELQDLTLACNPAIKDLLITSRRTMVRLIASNFDLYIDQLRDSLSSAPCQIHISSDLWTSPHRHALLAVCAQWVDSDYKLRKALLGLPECRFDHSGEHQARLIVEVLEQFGIQSRIGYHTSDNATSNDTCLKAMASQLWEKHGVEFDPILRRIRCIAHIINLSLQAFLLASSREALIAALEAASGVTGDELLAKLSGVLASQRESQNAPRGGSTTQTRKRRRNSRGTTTTTTSEDFNGVQNIPALRKLHDLCVWLRVSTTHSDLWDAEVGVRLGIDNTTRWSSWYHVINRLLRKIDQIKAFMTDHEARLGDIRLLASDWDLLRKAHAFLQPFASATLYAEGSTSSIAQSLFIMDLLLLHYEEQRDYYSRDGSNYDERMLRAIDMGWFILDKYYGKSDETPVYIAALLLNPGKRDTYIKQNWRAEWYEDAITAANSVWEADYNVDLGNDPPAVSVSMGPPPKRLGVELTRLMKKQEAKSVVSRRDVDDFKTFITSQPISIDCTPLEWWCKPDQRKNYPRLSRMAITILSIPAESSEAERTFSGTRRTCSWDRLRLKCATIEMIECIGNWLREGLIQPMSENGLGMPMSPAPESRFEDLDDQVADNIEWM